MNECSLISVRILNEKYKLTENIAWKFKIGWKYWMKVLHESLRLDENVGWKLYEIHAI